MFIVLVVGEYLHVILNLAQPYEPCKKFPMLIGNILFFSLFFLIRNFNFFILASCVLSYGFAHLLERVVMKLYHEVQPFE